MIELRDQMGAKIADIVITFAATHHPFKLTVEVSQCFYLRTP